MKRLALILLALFAASAAYGQQQTTRDTHTSFPRFPNSPVYAGNDCLAGTASGAGGGEFITSVNTGGGPGSVTQDTSPATNDGTYPFGSCQLQVITNTVPDRAYFGTNAVAFRFGKGTCRFRTRIYIDTLSDGTETYDLWIGFHDRSGASGPVDGAYLHYSSASNGGEWEAITINNSTSTGSVGDTNSAVAAATFYVIEIDVNDAGTSAIFKVNGTQIGSQTTNIPTGTGRDFGFGVAMNKAAGTTARTMIVDYIEGTCIPSTPRP